MLQSNQLSSPSMTSLHSDSNQLSSSSMTGLHSDPSVNLASIHPSSWFGNNDKLVPDYLWPKTKQVRRKQFILIILGQLLSAQPDNLQRQLGEIKMKRHSNGSCTSVMLDHPGSMTTTGNRLDRTTIPCN